jgi:hypothetical protein
MPPCAGSPSVGCCGACGLMPRWLPYQARKKPAHAGSPGASAGASPDTTLPFSAGLIEWLQGGHGMNRSAKTAVVVLMAT